MSDEFKCSACGGVFLKGWSDEEAAAERDHLFPGLDQDAGCLVCEDCFRAMGFPLVIDGEAETVGTKRAIPADTVE